MNSLSKRILGILPVLSVFSFIFQNVLATSNKMELIKRQFSGLFLAFLCPCIYGVVCFVPSVPLSDLSKLFPQLLRSFYLIVQEDDSQNKTNHTGTQGFKTTLENGAFLCSILFEVNRTF